MTQHNTIDHSGLTGVISSYASNANAVASVSAGGAATTVPRGDHVHDGVTSVSHTSNTFDGPVTLTAQGSIGITSPSAGTFAINAVAGAGAAGSTDLAGKELDYVQITADVSITGTTEGTATTIITGTSQSYSAVTTLVEFFSADVRSPTAAAGNAVVIVLYDGATLIGRMGVIITPAAAILGWAGTLSYRLTPTAATHQYIIKAHVSSTTGGPIISAGSGGSGLSLPAFLRITRVAS